MEANELDKSILDGMSKNVKALNPLILKVITDGLTNGKTAVDSLQLDAAKLGQSVIKTYYEYLLGKPLDRHELSTKDGKPMKIEWVFTEEDNDIDQEHKNPQVASTTSQIN